MGGASRTREEAAVCVSRRRSRLEMSDTQEGLGEDLITDRSSRLDGLDVEEPTSKDQDATSLRYFAVNAWLRFTVGVGISRSELLRYGSLIDVGLGDHAIGFCLVPPV